MNPRKFFAALVALVLTSTTANTQTASDPNESSQMSRDPAAAGAYTYSWWGRAGRTYFLQQSEDLINWTYVPVIEPGADQSIGWGFTSTADKFFVRLKYSDTPTDDPFNADFDGDHVSNYDELMQGTDPFSSVDSDHNGLPDDWEIRYLGAIGNDPNADPDGDGLTTIQEFQLHSDPYNFLNSTYDAQSDSDNNGLADWWEILHFGHLGNDPTQTVAANGGLTLKQIFDNHLDFGKSSTMGDNIPDSWKLAHGLDANDPYVSSEDPDGDGLTNGDEYTAGTDPMNWDTDGDYIADGDDAHPLVADPSQPQGAYVAVPSWEQQQQQPNPDYSLVDYTNIELRWQAGYNDPIGYRIRRRENNNVWHDLGTVGSGATTYSDQGLTANRHYQYQVISTKDASGQHLESDPVVLDYEVPLGLRLLVKQSSGPSR